MLGQAIARLLQRLRLRYLNYFWSTLLIVILLFISNAYLINTVHRTLINDGEAQAYVEKY
jgi:hypothetical protein